MPIDIAAENALTEGRDTFANLTTSGHGDIHAQGFARSISVNIGETVQFCVDGASTTIDIYRVGWYGGDGFRKVATVTNTPTTQPEAEVIPDTNGATTCTSWSVTAEWDVPSDATSGLYVALVRSVAPYAPNAFYISFVVRDDDAEADIIYKTSDSTWGAAYNHYGTKAAVDGKNVYGTGVGVGNIMDRSLVVDYHRPVITRGTVPQTFWMACEMPLIRFLERQGYSIKYVSSVDLDQQGVPLLQKGQIFLSSGHDEYWTTPMRDAVETWRDEHGGRSIFMSGNEVFWRARYIYDGDRVTMACYKDTMPGPTGYTRTAGSPFDPVMWTGTWKDTRWPDRRPEWFLTGTDFGMNGVYDYDVTVPKNPYGGLKVWGGSSLVDSDITLTRIMGFEADHAHPTQPAGSYRILAAYTRAAPGGLSDANGENYTMPGNIEWGIVAQRYAGGGFTVGFGTCQWSWALDATHDRGEGTPVSAAAQQFTVNLLNDMGAAPATLMSGVTLQPVNSLDEYAVEPGSQPAPATSWRLYDGTSVAPFLLLDGELAPLA
ncbi:N,N-dimethylformamidase beta subunit family domain-containing protein [Agromyces larvae]|uniref:N,N-dimethylformamidase beta subunit-like C-terminal domain-containing protein n=1 Tax=Agromyces larvae TaxID=2929802 RepID=A0ABY4C7L2_9MICO|nr:N,N-dimethylformamidase beta subunit family domain-containing protein [Agromyces larvae]UOE45988.1 hypothetical protein MTO99_09665 [Agromyces larvae]